MKKLLHKSWLPLFCLLLAASMAPSAQAGNVDFNCGKGFPTSTSWCVGTIDTDGTDYWTSGIGVYNSNGPFTASDTFSLEFDTTNSTISITEIGGSGATLTGTINTFQVIQQGTSAAWNIYLDVTWTSLPSIIQSSLGTQGGLSPMGLVIGVYRTSTTSTLQSEFVDISISPTPEPTTMILFGSGLLAGAGLLRRKMRRRQ